MIKREVFLKEKVRQFLIHGVLKYTFMIAMGLAGGFLAYQLMRFLSL